MDMTYRAVDVLQQADLIACEDTRVTGKLLKYFNIKTPMVSYNDHNGPKVRPKLVRDITAGKSVAIVSDAGTPLISDPGYKLVADCVENGIKVIPVPGASALLAGLVVSSLPTDRILFVGFLPSKSKAKLDALESVTRIDATLVFYENGSRLAATLKALSDALGDREAAIGRELTKLYEETIRGTLNTLAMQFETRPQAKGEIVIVVGPPAEQDALSEDKIDDALLKALETMTVRDASAEIAALSGHTKRSIYAKALELQAIKKTQGD